MVGIGVHAETTANVHLCIVGADMVAIRKGRDRRRRECSVSTTTLGIGDFERFNLGGEAIGGKGAKQGEQSAKVHHRAFVKSG